MLAPHTGHCSALCTERTHRPALPVVLHCIALLVALLYTALHCLHVIVVTMLDCNAVNAVAGVLSLPTEGICHALQHTCNA